MVEGTVTEAERTGTTLVRANQVAAAGSNQDNAPSDMSDSEDKDTVQKKQWVHLPQVVH